MSLTLKGEGADLEVTQSSYVSKDIHAKYLVENLLLKSQITIDQ